jgi:starch synthase
VAGALPTALAPEGIAVRTLVPGYPPVLHALEGGVAVASFDLFGGGARIIAAKAAGLDLFAIDAAHLYARDGDPYRAPDGHEWWDNGFRFAALSRVALLLAQGAVEGYRPDVVHAHDWQTGLAPAYLHYSGVHTPSVMTLHNLAFQGQYPAYLLGELGFPPEAYSVQGVEYYGAIGYLKAGLQFADRITTVSPTYAAEIRTPSMGMGMDGLLRARADVLSGILNGIDTTVWDPAHDRHLVGDRAANKAAVQERFGLQRDPGRMLFGVVSRFSEQKGIDLALAALPVLRDVGAQLVILGSGDWGFEAAVRGAAGPNVGVYIGYD